MEVVAKGMRQPWQLAYVPGHSSPLVSDLGQENLGKRTPPDYVVEVKPGANFGFPSCPAQTSDLLEIQQTVREIPASRLADGTRRTRRQALHRALRRHRQGT